MSSKHRIISKVLSPAVRLWLRSQVQQVYDLEVKISGGDRQILSGHIPRVSISARQAVYQGLHLTHIHLVGENIRINLGQVLRGQPLRLMEPIPVTAELLLQEADLNASLPSPLLSTALSELLGTLFPRYPIEGLGRWRHIAINNGQLMVVATLAADTDKPTPVVIRTGLQLASSHELQLEHPHLQTQLGLPLENLANFKLDLGPEVAIQELTLTPGQLVCRGRINVIPAADK